MLPFRLADLPYGFVSICAVLLLVTVGDTRSDYCNDATSISAAASVEPECPDPDDISPCVCENNNGELIMACSGIQDEEDLARVFEAFFPYKEFQRLTLSMYWNMTVLRNGVFGNIQFNHVMINQGALETIEEYAFWNMSSSLQVLELQKNRISSFPFDSLSEYSVLEMLTLWENKINGTLPKLVNPSLKTLYLGYNSITGITPGAFAGLPNLEKVYLNSAGRGLKSLPKGMFSGNPKLSYAAIDSNGLVHIHTGTFNFSSVLETLNLDGNAIADFGVGAIQGIRDMNLWVISNSLTTLDEEVWRPYLENNVTVYTHDNDLICGCDVGWIVLNPSFHPLMPYATCHGGFDVVDLDPAYFDAFC